VKLYVQCTSDTGDGTKTRAGDRTLKAKFTANTVGGRSEVDVTLEVEDDWNGDVVLKVDPKTIKRGFRIEVSE